MPEAAEEADGLATSKTDIPDEILSTLARLARMPAHQVRRESRLDTDLGLDSLTRLDLLLVLERRLGETIPDALLANLETVDDVVKLTETFQTDATQAKRELGKKEKLEFAQVPRWYARAFRAMITGIYRRYFSLECQGLEHIPQGRPYIIMPNHTSHLDTLTVITALGTKAYRLWTLAARDYWFANRLQGWFARHVSMHSR